MCKRTVDKGTTQKANITNLYGFADTENCPRIKISITEDI